MNQQPIRKSRLRLRAKLLLASITLVVILVAGGYFVNTALVMRKTASQQRTVTSTSRKVSSRVTATPIPSNKWITIQTFTGSGAKKTVSFTVPKLWRITWSCDLSSHNNLSYDIIIHANTTSNTLLGDSIETVCKKTNIQSATEVHRGGKVYLSIISEGAWRVQVQDVR